MSEKQATGAERQLVVFELDGQAFGVDISAVREIVRTQAVTRASHVDEAAAGFINLQGAAVPVIDLRARFGMAQGGRGEQQRVIIVDAGKQVIGMIVDAVTEVCRVPESHMQALSEEDGKTPYEKFVHGKVNREEGRILLLDPGRIISADEASQSNAA